MIYIPYFLILSLLGVIIMLNKSYFRINRVLTYIGIYTICPLSLIHPHSSAPIKFLGLSLQLINQSNMGYYFTVVFTITFICGVLYCLSFNKTNYKEIGLAFIFSGLAITTVSTNDLIITIMLIEILPIIAAAMIARNTTNKSKKVSIQVLVINLFGALLFSIGAESYISITQNTNIVNIISFNHYSKYLMLIGLLILIGFPIFLNWMVEELSTSSAKSAIFLSIFTPKIALFLLIKMFYGGEILLYSGIIFSIYGLVFSLFTPNLRKILSYAILHQVGFILIVAYSVSGSIDNINLTIFIATHIIFEVCFFIIAAICNNYFKHDNITRMVGFFHFQPLIGALLLIASLNVLGFPFTSGFIGKILVNNVMSSLDNSFVSFFIFFSAAAHALHVGFKIFYLLYLKAPAEHNIRTFKSVKINFAHILPIIILIFATIIYFIVVSILLPSVNSIANIYHELRITILGIIMFAFLIKFTNHNRELAIYDANLTIIQYLKNGFVNSTMGIKHLYVIFYINARAIRESIMKFVLLLPKLYFNLRIIIFILIIIIVLGIILFIS